MRIKNLRLARKLGGASHLGAVITAGLAVIFLFSTVTATADSVDQLQSQADSAHQQSQALQNQANQSASQAATLTGQIDLMNAQSAALKTQVARTQAQLDQLNAQMAQQESTLGAYVRDNYYLGNVSTLEALASAGSLSSFLDKRQYVQAVQDHINQLLSVVLETKKELDAKSALLKQQQARLADEIKAKNDLLAKTKGQESAYEALLAQSQAAEARLTRTIAAIMANGPVRSQGYVRAGQVIGHEGSTGNSTGAHLHFGAYLNSQPVSPFNYLNNGR